MFLRANKVRQTVTKSPHAQNSRQSLAAQRLLRTAKRPNQRQALIDSIVDIPVLPRWPFSVAWDGQEFGGMDR
jgi:hypothetical protein